MISHKFNGGFDPGDFKNSIPIYRVKYCDTPFTVKSEGIELKRYLITDASEPDFTSLSNLKLVDTLTTSEVGFYSSDGAMLGFSEVDNFALHYSGYFYPDHPSGNKYYTFKAYGHGYLRVYIANQTYAIGTNGYEVLKSKTKSGISGNTYLSAKTWTKIDIYYYTLSGQAGFTLMWRNPHYARFTPLSAGVLSKNGAFKESVILPDVVSVSRSEFQDEISSLTFQVPLVVSGSSDDGYYFNSFWDKYCHSTSNISLDKFKMIEFEAGYKNGGQEDYVKKFIGHIESFKPKREIGNNKLEIECVGFENLFKQSLNLNYPNEYDYWNAEYAGYSSTSTNPDGVSMPPTYDGWELNKVFKSLCIRAHIDPYLFLKKRTFLNLSDEVVSGTYLIEETSPIGVVLDTNINYGNSVVVNEDIGSVPDDEYIIKSTFGQDLFDYINTITDVYGWKWGCNSYYDGAPYLMSNNNPYAVYKVDSGVDSTTGYGCSSSLLRKYDINAIGGVYNETNTETDYLDFTFKGSKVNLIIVGGTDSGNETGITDYASNLSSIVVSGTAGFTANERIIIDTVGGEESKVISSISSNTFNLDSALTNIPRKEGYVRKATFSAVVKTGLSYSSGTTVQTTYHSCYFPNQYDRYINSSLFKENTNINLDSKRFYYEGIDPKTSVNPCSISLMDNQAYDEYIVRIKRLNNTEAGSTNYMRVNSLMVYDRDSNKIVETYHTGDSVVSGTVISLNVEDSGVDLRNDTIVVGRRLGVDVAGSEGSVININNPTYHYIISRATDVASIYNPEVKNYVGMPRQTIQIAPEISSQDRANYWAVSFINRYRYPGKFPEFSALGHPLMEVNDCIAVYDEGKKTLNTYDKFWLVGIGETYEPKKYISNFTTTSYEPWESYTPKLELTNSYFDNVPIQNLTITNGGNGEVGTTDTQRYDPYSSDSSGKRIIVKYDLLVDGYVRIDVYPYERPELRVATLLNPTGNTGPEGWSRQEVGKNYIATWDGVDFYGDWNKYCTEGETEEIGAGYFAHEGRLLLINGKGKFYLKISILKRGTEVPLIIYSKDSDYLGSNGYIYIQRGSAHNMRMSISPVTKTRFTLKTLPPSGCFNDSLTIPTTTEKAAFKIQVYENLSGNETYVDPSVYSTLEKRAVQLKIIGHNVVLMAVTLNLPGGPTRKISRIIPAWQDVYYDNQSFQYYDDDGSLERYVSPKLFGYRYDYTQYVDETTLNLVTTHNGYIYMGWYIYVEVIARDKSGRRATIYSPSPLSGQYSVESSGAWVFWMDDNHPIPQPTDTDSNMSGYGYGIYNVGSDEGEVKASLTSFDGTNLVTDSLKGIGSTVQLIRVYPKTDVYGNPWGY